MKKNISPKFTSQFKKKIKPYSKQTTLFGMQTDRYEVELKTATIQSAEKFKILHWNVNGIRAILKKGVLDHFFKNFDIICLSETKICFSKLKEDQVHFNKMWYGKFLQYWSLSTKKSGYSGCVVFSKLRPIKVRYGIGVEQFDSEGRFTVVEYKDFFLVNVYVPNSKRGLHRLKERVEEFDEEFRKFLENLKKQKMLIVVGDFNVAHQEIDIADPKGNRRNPGFTDEERQSFSKLLDCGLVDIWRQNNKDVVKYSWWSNLQKNKTRAERKGWRIDYCLVSKEHEHHIEKTILRDDVLGSDHCPMEIHMKFQQSQNIEDQNKDKDSKKSEQNDKKNDDEEKDINTLKDDQNEQNLENFYQQEDSKNQSSNHQENYEQNAKQNEKSEMNCSNKNEECSQKKDSIALNNSITFQNFMSHQHDKFSNDQDQFVEELESNNKKKVSEDLLLNKAFRKKNFSFGESQKPSQIQNQELPEDKNMSKFISKPLFKKLSQTQEKFNQKLIVSSYFFKI